MSAIRRHADEIPLRGGHVALDFANTSGWHASEAPKEWHVDYDELLRWGEHVGLHAHAEASALRAEASRHPSDAAHVLGRVRSLREALFRVCRATARGSAARPADRALIAAEHAEAGTHTVLVPSVDGFALVLEPRSRDTLSLDRPRWRLARVVVDLLTSPDLARVRECEGAPCGWLFIDRSRNRTRRWCASAECGNRERVRRHYAAKSATRST